MVSGQVDTYVRYVLSLLLITSYISEIRLVPSPQYPSHIFLPPWEPFLTKIVNSFFLTPLVNLSLSISHRKTVFTTLVSILA